MLCLLTVLCRAALCCAATVQQSTTAKLSFLNARKATVATTQIICETCYFLWSMYPKWSAAAVAASPSPAPVPGTLKSPPPSPSSHLAIPRSSPPAVQPLQPAAGGSRGSGSAGATHTEVLGSAAASRYPSPNPSPSPSPSPAVAGPMPPPEGPLPARTLVVSTVRTAGPAQSLWMDSRPGAALEDTGALEQP